MLSSTPGKCIRIFVEQRAQWQGHNLHTAIVQECHKLDVARVTVLLGIMGFGAAKAVHTLPRFGLKSDAPVIIEIVDTAERVEQVLALLRDMIGEATWTETEVELFKWGKA